MSRVLRAVEGVGDEVLYYVEHVGRMVVFLLATLASALRPPYDGYQLLKQLHFVGARSMLVIVVSGLFTGMVLALQFHDTLARFGTLDLLGSAVAIALLRELGPVMAALMVIARAGSAMTAEIGIMRTSEQIDAIECMAINPLQYLIAPKVIAAVISLPLLTSVFDLLGVVGGWIVAVGLFGMADGTYFQSMAEGAQWQDIRMGLIKSVVFGLLIGWIATAKGYYLHLDRSGTFGAEGVSRVTTNAVVLSAIAVLFADYLVGAIML